ncbi:MAG: sodium:solute symporter family protein [Verrucomicrobiota bacterium]
MNDNLDQLDFLGRDGVIFLGGYLVLLLFIGVLGHRAKKAATLEDFYLGGRNMGFIVLLLTLYATQYSGNTLLGFVGKAYRGDFHFLVSVTFMMSIIGAYLVYAPALFRRSRKNGYITTGDFIQDRFGYRPLTVWASLLGVIALANYILTNLKVLGFLVERISGGEISFAAGVVILAIVIILYELLGGLRAVAWTDVLQGVILLFGILIIFIALQQHTGGLAAQAASLEQNKPGVFATPTGTEKITWASTLLLIFAGISMYPHAVQRIYAARNEKTLRRSLQIMVFFPLITTFLMVSLGILGAAKFADLTQEQSETVTLRLLADLVRESPGLRWLVILFISAIVAGTMSTIDSSMLAISSKVTRDLFQPFFPGASEKALGLAGKGTSLALMSVIVYLTILLKDSKTIWRLIEIKLELLCQVAPAVMLGVHWKRMKTGPVFAGMVAGTLLAVLISALESIPAKPLGIHGGVWGLLLNLLIVVVGSILMKDPTEDTSPRQSSTA